MQTYYRVVYQHYGQQREVFERFASLADARASATSVERMGFLARVVRYAV